MKSKDKELRALDDEYAAALADRQAADKRLADVAARREAAYIDSEYARSAEAQRLGNLTDDEWKALRQRVKAARGPKLEPEVPAPGTE